MDSFYKQILFACVSLCLGVAQAATQQQVLVQDIDTAALQKMLKTTPDMVLIDIRLPAEIDGQGGAIAAPQNVNIPRGWLEFRVDDFVYGGKDTPVVVYCGTGLRSPLAAKTLTKMGYTQVYNYREGVQDWQKKALPQRRADDAHRSILFQLPKKVIKGVWSAIGETAPATVENSGHNNNLSFVIGDKVVLVVNAGRNYLLAEALHREIKKITDKPVRYVVLENAQDHAILGSNYWQEQGAQVIAHADAVRVIQAKQKRGTGRASRILQDKLAYTQVVMPDIVFSDQWQVDLGNRKVEVKYLGPAHGPGDIIVWLPDDKLVITGDVAFHERLLPIFPSTQTAAWIETWEKLEALGASVVIPGHGGPTDMATVRKYTKEYLVYMRAQVAQLLDAGKSSVDAYGIDQSAFKHLDTFEQLYRRNAARIFSKMEFE